MLRAEGRRLDAVTQCRKPVASGDFPTPDAILPPRGGFPVRAISGPTRPPHPRPASHKEHPLHLLSVFSLRNRALIALVTIVVGGLRRRRADEPQAGAHPVALAPAARDRHDATRAPRPRSSTTTCRRPIETAIQGVAGLEVTTATSQHQLSRSITAVVHLRHQPRHRRAEDPAGDQPHQADAARRRRPAGAHRQPRRPARSSRSPSRATSPTQDLAAADRTTRRSPTSASSTGVATRACSARSAQRVTITPDADEARWPRASTTRRSATRSTPTARCCPRARSPRTARPSRCRPATRARLDRRHRRAAAARCARGGTLQPTIGDVATVELDRRPGHRHLARQRRAVASRSRSRRRPTATPSTCLEARHATHPAELEDDLGGDTQFTVVFDQAPFIEQSIDSLATEGLLGLVFAVLVILVFLLSIRSTLVTAISIPTSVLITFIGMQAAGYTLNILTLGALTIAIGRVVDDSIVVIENIKRHLATLGARPARRAITRRPCARSPAPSPRRPITTVAVFLPIAFVGDITGELFRPFALTVDHRARRVAVRLADDRAGARLLVPAAPKSADDRAAPAAARSDAHERRAASTPTRPAARVPAGHPAGRSSARVVTLARRRSLVLGRHRAPLRPLLKTNFLGRQRAEHADRHADAAARHEPRRAGHGGARRSRRRSLGIDGVETVQLSIGSSGNSLARGLRRAAAARSRTRSRPTPTPTRTRCRATCATRLDGARRRRRHLARGRRAGFASSDIEVDITAERRATCETAADAILDDGARTSTSVAQATSNLSATQPYIAVDGRPRRRPRRPGSARSPSAASSPRRCSRARSARSSIDETTARRSTSQTHGRRRRRSHELEDVRRSRPRRALVPLIDARDRRGGRRARERSRPIKGVRSATVTRHARRATTSARPSPSVAGASPTADLPAGATATLGGVDLAAGRRVLAARPRAARRDPDRLRRHGRDVQEPAAAAAAARVGAVRGDRRDPAAARLGHPARRAVAHRRAHAHRHRRDERDRARRPRATSTASAGESVREAIVSTAPSRRLRPILMTALATIFALLPLGRRPHRARRVHLAAARDRRHRRPASRRRC